MEKTNKAVENKPPDIFGSWKNLYLLVIGNLAFLILVFYLITLSVK